MPAPHYSVFYRPDALPAAQNTFRYVFKITVKLITAEASNTTLCPLTQDFTNCNNLSAAQIPSFTSSIKHKL